MSRPGILIAAAFLALALFPARTEAEIYRWVDADGIVHFQDYLPPAGEATDGLHVSESRETPSPEGALPEAAAEETALPVEPEPVVEKEEETPPSKVDLYTTSWCPQCEKARRYFRARGVSFTEYDVEKDRKAARRWKRTYRARGVPLAIVNNEKILGYAPSRYDRALAGR